MSGPYTSTGDDRIYILGAKYANVCKNNGYVRILDYARYIELKSNVQSPAAGELNLE